MSVPDQVSDSRHGGRASSPGPGGAPTLEEVKEWLGLEADDDVDDVVLQRSLDAAIMTQAMVCQYPVTDDAETGELVEVVPADLYDALLLRTQRYAARRSSPEGVVGLSGTGGDFVAARLPSTDADIVRLEGPWLRTPVA